MAPQLPDRYRTHVRLGRDHDVEEWLATDTALDRPVMVRVLTPSAGHERATGFVAAARAAAGVTHPHLTSVYEVGTGNGTIFAVTEWNGGVTVADRLGAADALPADEFLPNASGLAAGLAELHRRGAVHGGIDTSAIEFSAAHPAKLGAFGRPRGRNLTPADDTRALAAALREAVTGSQDTAIGPSEVVMGLPPRLDVVLASAEAGEIGADALSGALRALPQPEQSVTKAGWSWTWAIAAAALAIAIIVVGLAGLAIDVDPDSPFLFPATPAAEPQQVTTTAAPETSPPNVTPEGSLAYTPRVFDPFGEGSENDDSLGALQDDDPATAWSTERYFRPLSEVKPGVGIMFELADQPGRVVIQGSAGTSFALLWSESATDSLEGFSPVGSGTLGGTGSRVQLPPRVGGTWLIWLTDLPEPESGVYLAEIHTVAFQS